MLISCLGSKRSGRDGIAGHLFKQIFEFLRIHGGGFLKLNKCRTAKFTESTLRKRALYF